MLHDYSIEELELIKGLASNIMCDLCRIKMAGRLPENYKKHIENKLDMYGNLLGKTEDFIENTFKCAYAQERNKQ